MEGDEAFDDKLSMAASTATAAPTAPTATKAEAAEGAVAEAAKVPAASGGAATKVPADREANGKYIVHVVRHNNATKLARRIRVATAQNPRVRIGENLQNWASMATALKQLAMHGDDTHCRIELRPLTGMTAAMCWLDRQRGRMQFDCHLASLLV